MKKRAKITPFAKLIIAGLLLLGLRYLYLNRETILSGNFFDENDTTKSEELISDKLISDDSIDMNSDSLKVISEDSIKSSVTDTFTLNIERSEDLFTLNASDLSINILLKDSVSVSDTIFFNVSDEKNIIGRIIIK